MAQTPLTVGSPQQVIDRTLGFREFVGDYQRQLFLVDHAGLPLTTVMEQLDFLAEIVPVLRREFDRLRRPGVPDGPTHDGLKAAKGANAAKGAGASEAGTGAAGASQAETGAAGASQSGTGAAVRTP
jgi:hypothetical protein